MMGAYDMEWGRGGGAQLRGQSAHQLPAANFGIFFPDGN